MMPAADSAEIRPNVDAARALMRRPANRGGRAFTGSRPRARRLPRSPRSRAAGAILREEFMAPLGLSAGQIAKALGLPRSRIERIVKEDIGISTDTALRLGRLLRTTPQFWLNLQATFERETLLREIGPELERIEPVPVPEAA